MTPDTTPAEPIASGDGVAVIGLGKMGLPMARHLRGAGFRVSGYDPSPACQDRAAALVVVGFDEQAVEVISEPGRGLLAEARPGFVIAICSTVQTSTSLQMAEAADKVGAGSGVSASMSDFTRAHL
jgi:3-hydroxyisobutyrate dehydrogenase-like beta-hydroxyacid dehydrogenase